VTETVSPTAVGVSAPAAPVAKVGYRYVLWILLFIYIFNFLDRQILNILAEDVKHDLKLSDGQLGMMTGLVFAVFYTTLGIPIARLADKTNRVWVIGACLTVWSAFTMIGGLSQNFIQMMLSRIGVAAGEAGCSPPAHSLIAQTVPREKRAGALAFYAIGVPIGSMLSFTVGGLLVGQVGWRMTMFILGAPGILLALLFLLTVKDPRRGGIAHEAQAADEVQPTFVQTMALLAKKPAFWWMSAGGAFTAFVSYTQGNFVASFFRRSHAQDLERVAASLGDTLGVHLTVTSLLGPCLGVVVASTGIIGTLWGGWITDKAKGVDLKIYCGVPAICALLMIPFTYAFLHVSNVWFALLLLTAPLGLKTVWHGMVYSTGQSVVPPRCRAMAAALVLFIVNMIGLGGGPTAVGHLSDVYANGLMGPTGLTVDICKNTGQMIGSGHSAVFTYAYSECAPAIADGLRKAMFTCSFGAVASAFCFWMGSRTLKRDMVS